ncbi:MAG: ABC transporter permease subunit [Candidatus Auribacterota bacterium]
MKQVLAIAHKTVLKALHDKMFAGITLIFLIILPLLPLLLRGDGSVIGHLRLFISYSVNFSIFFLSLLAIFMACNSLYEEMFRKQMFLLATKPVRKWQIIAGHWLGTCIIVGTLLAGATVINYGGLRWIYSHQKSVLTEEQHTDIAQNFFSARKTALPDNPDIDSMVEESVLSFRKANPNDKTPAEELRETYRKRLFYKLYCIPVNFQKKWTVSGIKGVKGDVFNFRFKYYTSEMPPDGKINGKWVFGEAGITEEHEVFTDKSPETYHTLTLPVSVISADGTLQVKFTNQDNDMLTLIMPDKDNVEVLYESGIFVINYLKASLLIFCQIAALVAIGVLFSAFLSFPVACLMTLFFFGIGTMAEHFVQMLSAPVVEEAHGHSHGQEAEHEAVESIFDLVARKLVGSMIQVFPHFDTINPTRFLTDGRFIDSSTMMWGFGIILLLQGGTALILGTIILHRKELAKVTI